MKIKRNKSKSLNDKIYLTYNQITKEYDVIILTEKEFDQLSDETKREVRHMILRKKNTFDPPGPPEPPAWFKYWCKHDFKNTIENLRTELKQEIADVRTELKQEISYVRTELKQEISDVKEKVDKVNKRLDNIVSKNNLIE